MAKASVSRKFRENLHSGIRAEHQIFRGLRHTAVAAQKLLTIALGDEEEHRAGAEEYAGQQHLHDAGTDQRARQRIEPVEEGHHCSRAAEPARDVRRGVDIDTLRSRAATVKVIIFGDRIHVALRHKAEIEQRGQQQRQRAHQPAG